LQVPSTGVNVSIQSGMLMRLMFALNPKNGECKAMLGKSPTSTSGPDLPILTTIFPLAGIPS